MTSGTSMFHIYNYFKRNQTTEIPSSLTEEDVKQADELVEKVREATEPCPKFVKFNLANY